MGLYIAMDCANCTKKEYDKLIAAIGKNTYGIVDTSVVIPLKSWSEAKKGVLKQSSKYKAVQYSLVDVTKGVLTPKTVKSEVFSDDFLDMERQLPSYTKKEG